MKFKKWALAAAAAATLGAGPALANEFTIDLTGLANVTGGPLVTADEIIAGYNETVTFDGLGNVAVSVAFDTSNFRLNGANVGTAVSSGIVGNSWSLYGLFQGVGTVSGNNITLDASQSSYTLWIDPTDDGVFTAPATGAGAYTVSNNGDDYQIANGDLVVGIANLLPGCAQNNCGSVGQTVEVNLTPDGENFFVSPSPFYLLSLQTAQLETQINTGPGTQTYTGSFNIKFANEVPEPGSLALAGLALLGAAGAMRKRG